MAEDRDEEVQSQVYHLSGFRVEMQEGTPILSAIMAEESAPVESVPVVGLFMVAAYPAELGGAGAYRFRFHHFGNPIAAAEALAYFLRGHPPVRRMMEGILELLDHDGDISGSVGHSPD